MDTLFEINPTIVDWVGPQWAEVLEPAFSFKGGMLAINVVRQGKASGHTVYPSGDDVFNAFKLCPLNKTKVVILGQDPYHDGSAHGLAFSTLGKVTPSLRVIFRELQNCGISRTSPNFTDWAKQGVLLLNTVLTVTKGKPNSHAGIGWEFFTKEVLQVLMRSKQPITFILWGKSAQTAFDDAREGLPCEHKLILRAAHPQAENYSGGKSGFYGSHHFVKINQWLEAYNLPTIEWGNT